MGITLDHQTKTYLSSLIGTYNPKVPTSLNPVLKQTAGEAKFIVFSDEKSLAVDIEESVYALFHHLHDTPTSTDSRGNPVTHYRLGELPTERRKINPIGHKPLDKGCDPHSGLYVLGLSDKNYKTLLWMKSKGMLEALQGASARSFAMMYRPVLESNNDTQIWKFLTDLMTDSQRAEYDTAVRLEQLPSMYALHTTKGADNSSSSHVFGSMSTSDPNLQVRQWKELLSLDNWSSFFKTASPEITKTRLEAELIQLQARYNSLMREIRTGTIDDKDARREKNRLFRSAMSIIDSYAKL